MISYILFLLLLIIIFCGFLPPISIVISLGDCLGVIGITLGVFGIVLSILFSLCGNDVFKKLSRVSELLWAPRLVIHLMFNCTNQEIEWLYWWILRHFDPTSPNILIKEYILANEIRSPKFYILEKDPSNHLPIALSLCSKSLLLKQETKNGTGFLMSHKLAKLINPNKEYYVKSAKVDVLTIVGDLDV